MNTFIKDKLEKLSRIYPEKIYFVGGCLRDLFLKRYTYDYDFIILGNAIETAKKLARETKGAFVLLDEERDIGRVVWNKKLNGFDLMFDISKLSAKSIEEDLLSRDLSINSLALELDQKIIENFNASDFYLFDLNELENNNIIDFSKGFHDLKNGIIKTAREVNLIDDPLRMLRVFRFASKFNFTIEEKTLEYVKKHFKNISFVASERILKEFYDILGFTSSDCIKKMFETKLLNQLLTKLTTEINSDTEKEIIIKINFFETKIINLKNIFNHDKEISDFLNSTIILDRKRLALIKFIIMFYYLKTKDSKTYLLKLEAFLKFFTFGSEEQKIIIKNLTFIFNEEKNILNKELSRTNLYKYFTELKEESITNLLLLYIFNPSNLLKEKINQVITFYYEDKILSEQPKIIDGNDIKTIFSLTGKDIGLTIEKIRQAQAEKIVSTYDDAIDFVKKTTI